MLARTPAAGLALVTIAFLFAPLLDVISKWLVQTHAPAMVGLMRFAAQVAILVPLVAAGRQWGRPRAGHVVGGVLLGTALPEGLPLDFALPLVFMVLLIPAVEDRATTVAAAVGGFVAVLAAGLPSGTGLLVGAAAGITAGVVVAWR
jgi:hypothetical protein